MRVKGRITSWNDEKGYGFITPAVGRERVFVHISAFGNRGRRAEVNQMVTYALSKDDQGRACAAKATLAGDRLDAARKPTSGWWATPGAGIFLVIVAGLVASGTVPLFVFVLYVNGNRKLIHLSSDSAK